MTDRIRVLHTEGDYAAAMAEVSALFDNPPRPGTAAGDRFEVLIALIEKYECAKPFHARTSGISRVSSATSH